MTDHARQELKNVYPPLIHRLHELGMHAGKTATIAGWRLSCPIAVTAREAEDEIDRLRWLAAKWEAVEPYLIEADRRYNEAMEIGDTQRAGQMYPYIAQAMKAAALAEPR